MPKVFQFDYGENNLQSEKELLSLNNDRGKIYRGLLIDLKIKLY